MLAHVAINLLHSTLISRSHERQLYGPKFLKASHPPALTLTFEYLQVFISNFEVKVGQGAEAELVMHWRSVNTSQGLAESKR